MLVSFSHSFHTVKVLGTLRLLKDHTLDLVRTGFEHKPPWFSNLGLALFVGGWMSNKEVNHTFSLSDIEHKLA